MTIRYIIFLILINIALISCKSGSDKQGDKNAVKIELQYAKGLEIQQFKDYKLITVIDPWQGANSIEYNYYLINKNSKKELHVSNGTIIKTPIERVVCLSTTHIAFIDVLNKINTIVGVSGSNYVNNVDLRSKIDQKKVLDVGYDNSLNYELIASLNPDIVITYGIGSQVASYNQKLNDLGINTIINAEYLENDPLGKLEWIKFIAAFYELDDKANEYFEKVVNEYNSLLNLTENIVEKPKVLFGLPWKDSWFVPGGNSYLAKMVNDAGGDYFWKDNELRESIPFDIESIFLQAASADIWLNTGTANLKSDILKVDSRFAEFRPFNNSIIYNNNKRMNKYGGNDYWESGLTEPQLVLKDMIKILHPDLLQEYELVYYKAIQ